MKNVCCFYEKASGNPEALNPQRRFTSCGRPGGPGGNHGCLLEDAELVCHAHQNMLSIPMHMKL